MTSRRLKRKPWVICWFLLAAMMAPHTPWLEGKEKEIKLCCSPGPDRQRLPAGWERLGFKKIPRHTEYRLEEERGHYYVKAISKTSASGIVRKIRFDPKVYQKISWHWKIMNVLKKGDEKKKEGDDYPARIYITFEYDPEKVSLWERTKFFAIKTFYGEYPPTGAINYIWGNKLPKGESVDNAYTDRVKMIAVESGDSLAGEWVREERNLYQDYQRLFGEEPPRVSGIAMMTDTDNTGESAEAYYADIVLQPAE